MNYKKTVVTFFLLLVSSLMLMTTQIPGEYEPKEDRNLLLVNVSAQEGINFYAMQNYMESVLKVMHPLLDDKIATNILMMVPGFGSTLGAVNSGMFIVDLIDQTKRKKSVFEIVNDLNKK